MKCLSLTCFYILIALANATIASAQTEINVPAPNAGPLPAAFSRRGGAEVSFRMAHNNQYAIAFTDKEAKVWKMPEGILVYRYQMGSNLESVAWNVIRDVSITADGKYVYTSGRSWNELVLGPVELESGASLGPGPVLDSLKSGAYQAKRGARNKSELSQVVLNQMQKALRTERDYDLNDSRESEDLEITTVVQDKTEPGGIVVVTKQEYCRSGRWVKEAAEKMGMDYSTLKKWRKETNHCQLSDYHIYRYQPATGKTEYLGQPARGVEKVDHRSIETVYPSPYADIVAIRFGTADSIAVHSVRGVPLWSTPAGEKWRFDHWDDEGNLVLRLYGKGITQYHFGPTRAISVRRPLTGAVVREYRTTDAIAEDRQHIIDEWGMLANIKISDKDFTIGLYSIEDGRWMMALTDEAGAVAFSQAHKAEAEAIRKQYEQNRLANERAYAAMQESYRKHQAAADAAEAKKYAANAAAAEEHARYYRTCPQCGGSRGEYVEDVYTTQSSTKLMESKYYTTYQVTTDRHVSPYKKFQPCTRCWGKGEIRK